MNLLLATQNPGKLREIQAILRDLDITVIAPSTDFDVEETGETFEENAWLKAKGFSEKFDILTLSDDSGLIVDALDGRPGVYSKRYGKDDDERITKLLLEMEGKEDRSARFISVMCLHGEGIDQCFEGTVEGTIAQEARGKEGFGYDPIFIPEGYEKTFAQLGNEVKNKLSHRARAMEKVKGYLRDKLQGER